MPRHFTAQDAERYYRVISDAAEDVTRLAYRTESAADPLFPEQKPAHYALMSIVDDLRRLESALHTAMAPNPFTDEEGTP